MKNNIRSAKTSLIISILALIIAWMNLIYSSITDHGMSVRGASALCYAMIAVFCINITSYRAQKNNQKNSHK